MMKSQEFVRGEMWGGGREMKMLLALRRREGPVLQGARNAALDLKSRGEDSLLEPQREPGPAGSLLFSQR